MRQANAKTIAEERLAKVDEVFKLVCEGNSLRDAIRLKGNPFSQTYFCTHITEEQRNVLRATRNKMWGKNNVTSEQINSKVDEIFELVKAGNTIRYAIIKAGNPFNAAFLYKILSPEQKRLLREYKCACGASLRYGGTYGKNFLSNSRGRGKQAIAITNLFNENFHEPDDEDY